jgi:hypothetical protein
MATWQDRVASSIKLTSPQSGTVFTPYWRGDDISIAKRVGQFKFPLIDGTVTQDLGLDGFGIPLTLYFAGENNDLDAWAFAQCWTERGPWTVIHPVYGTLSLQPLSGTLKVQPVESGNITVVESQWIRPVQPGTLASGGKVSGSGSAGTLSSVGEIAGAINAQIDTVNASAAAAFAACPQSTIDNLFSAETQITPGITIVKAALMGINADVNRIQSQINAEFLSFPGDLATIAGLAQSLIQTPALMAGSLAAQISRYASMLAGILGTLPSSLAIPNTNTYNAVAATELLASAALSASALAVILTTPATRPDAVATLNQILAMWNSMTASFDGFQTAFAGNSLVGQYFTAAQSYTDLSRLIALAVQYLLSVIFDLKSEIRFTLKAERAPFEIAVSYYGQNGWDDTYFDAFIASNNLTGDRILILPAGYEVVVYA